MTTIIDDIKRNNQKLGEMRTCQISVLSPLHVGCGITLKKGLDFYTEGGKTVVVPQSAMLKYLESEENEADLQKFLIESRDKTEILKNVKEDVRIYSHQIEGSDIQVFFRNGLGQPTIPGSSIKGAIRTAVFNDLYRKLPEQVKDENIRNLKSGKQDRIADELSKKLFGRDPNNDLFRALTIGDATFKNSNFGLYQSKVLKLDNSDGSRFVWKKIKDTDKEMKVNAEMLKANSGSTFTIKFDDFLLKDRKLFGNKDLNFGYLCRVINKNAANLLKQYSEYFKKLEQKPTNVSQNTDNVFNVLKSAFNTVNELENIQTQLSSLSAQVEGIQNSTTKFIMPLAWGIGWEGMTGAFLMPNQREDLRRRNIIKQGTRGFPIFPKSKKIVFVNDTPQYLCGWVMVELI